MLFRAADTEYLGSASAAYALGGWLTVFHCDGFGIFNFFFRAAFYAISFHLFPPNVIFILVKLIVFHINFYFYFTSHFFVVKMAAIK